MKKFFVVLFVVTLVIGLTGITNVYAISLDLDGANNITIWDGQKRSDGYLGEDNETEPHTQEGQEWDLEAFFLKGNALTMVGGFDFKNGESGYSTGDLFIDIDGDAQYAYGENPTIDNWGYEYAIRFNFVDTEADEHGSYDVGYDIYQLDNDTEFLTTVPNGVEESNPWRVEESTATNLTTEMDGRYWEGLSDSQVQGLSGSWDGDWKHHYALQIDLSNVDGYSSANTYFHLTMECGNDDLIGYIPEPSTIFLIGLGLLGIVGLGWKRMKE